MIFNQSHSGYRTTHLRHHLGLFLLQTTIYCWLCLFLETPSYHWIILLVSLLDIPLVRSEALDGEQVEAGVLTVQPLGHAQDALVVVTAIGPIVDIDLENPVVVAI